VFSAASSSLLLSISLHRSVPRQAACSFFLHIHLATRNYELLLQLCPFRRRFLSVPPRVFTRNRAVSERKFAEKIMPTVGLNIVREQCSDLLCESSCWTVSYWKGTRECNEHKAVNSGDFCGSSLLWIMIYCHRLIYEKEGMRIRSKSRSLFTRIHCYWSWCSIIVAHCSIVRTMLYSVNRPGTGRQGNRFSCNAHCTFVANLSNKRYSRIKEYDKVSSRENGHNVNHSYYHNGPIA